MEEEIANLKAQIEAVNSKNTELLKELRTAKNKNKEIDPENYSKVLEENDALSTELAKLKNDLGLKTKDIEQLTGKLSEKEDYLKNLTLENSLNEELSKIGLNPIISATIKDGFKAKSKISDDGSILIGDKPITEYLSEWAKTDAGQYAIMPSGNSGTNASGGNQPPNNDNKPATIKDMLSGMFKN